MIINSLTGENVASVGMELHAISSAAKPICTWAARDGIQECREACGGHGYLKSKGKSLEFHALLRPCVFQLPESVTFVTTMTPIVRTRVRTTY
jgi:alkylation response protein AidB-like acyl-CoA dehydrogenase